MLEERRIRQDSYSGALRKGMARNANIILDPVRQFSSNGSKRPSQGPKGSFELGDRVYHDIFGEGEVQGVRTVRGKEMVDVRFSTGKVTTFFSENVVLEKLARD